MKSIFNQTSIHEMLSYLILNHAFSKRDVASFIQIPYTELNTVLKSKKHKLHKKRWTEDVINRLERFYMRLYMNEHLDSGSSSRGEH